MVTTGMLDWVVSTPGGVEMLDEVFGSEVGKTVVTTVFVDQTMLPSEAAGCDWLNAGWPS